MLVARNAGSSTEVWEATLWDVWELLAARNVRLDEVVGWRGQSSGVGGVGVARNAAERPVAAPLAASSLLAG